jgi:choice-of-anchor A domain-containing protein
MVEVLNGNIKVGNLAGSAVDSNDTTPPSVDALTHVTVAGAASDATPQIKSDHAQPSTTVGLTAGETLPDFGGAFATFQDNSNGLAQCANNVILLDPNTGLPLDPQVIPASGRVRIQLTPGVQNVLNLTAAEFANITEITFLNSPTQDTPLIVNISGSSVTWPNMTTPGLFLGSAPLVRLGIAAAPYILYNMPEATQLTRTQGDSVEGTIYAPQANFIDTASSNIEGDIITASLYRNGGEYHHAPFDAPLTPCGVSPTPTPTPTSTLTPTPTPTSTPTPTPTPASTPMPTPTSTPIAVTG